MKDRNDHEIRTGDIIESSYGIPSIKIRGTVVDNGRAFIVLTPGHDALACSLEKFVEWFGNVEVVDNIHTNNY